MNKNIIVKAALVITVFLYSSSFSQTSYPKLDCVKCETGFTDEFGLPKTKNEWGYCQIIRDSLLIFQGFTYDIIRNEKQRRDLRFSIGLIRSSEMSDKFPQKHNIFQIEILDVLTTLGRKYGFVYKGNFKVYDDSLQKSPEFLLVRLDNGVGDYIRSLPDTANSHLFNLYDSLVYFPNFDRKER